MLLMSWKMRWDLATIAIVAKRLNSLCQHHTNDPFKSIFVEINFEITREYIYFDIQFICNSLFEYCLLNKPLIHFQKKNLHSTSEISIIIMTSKTKESKTFNSKKRKFQIHFTTTISRTVDQCTSTIFRWYDR